MRTPYLSSFLSFFYFPLHHYYKLDLCSCYCFHHFDKWIHFVRTRTFYLSPFFSLLYLSLYPFNCRDLFSCYCFDKRIHVLIMTTLYLSSFRSFLFIFFFSIITILLIYSLLLFLSVLQEDTYFEDENSLSLFFFFFSFLFFSFLYFIFLSMITKKNDVFSFYRLHHFDKRIYFLRTRIIYLSSFPSLLLLTLHHHEILVVIFVVGVMARMVVMISISEGSRDDKINRLENVTWRKKTHCLMSYWMTTCRIMKIMMIQVAQLLPNLSRMNRSS